MKKYIYRFLFALILSIFIPLRMVTGTDFNCNDSTMTVKEASSDSDGILKNTEIIDNDIESGDEREYENISKWALSINGSIDSDSEDVAEYSAEKEIPEYQAGEEIESDKVTYADDWDDDITESFTDPYFCLAIREKLWLDENEPITKDICSEVTELDISQYAYIESLSGIEYFTNLKELYCYENKIKTLDVSMCKNLEILHCNLNQLTKLDISGCSKLNDLICSANRLKEINVSGCINLKDLFCSKNQLEMLDLSNCINLESLACDENQLTTLAIDKCKKLSYLQCRNNKLEVLDVSKCGKLEGLACEKNQLNTLNINNCSKLADLNCSVNKLKMLSLNQTPNLQWLDCSKNQLSGINVNSCSRLNTIECAYNQLHLLNVNKCPKLSLIDCRHNYMSSPLDVVGKRDKNFLTSYFFKFAPQDQPYIKTNSIEIRIGGQAKSLKVYNAKSKITYMSSNPNIVKVDSEGTVIPKSIGKATITIKIAGIITSPKVNVTVSGIDVTRKYKAKTQKILRNFDQYFGFCCGKGATFKYDVYARTNMLSIPNLHKILGKSTKYAKNELSSDMKLFFGTSSVKFKKFSGRYKWRKDPSNIVVNKNGKIEYTSGNWGHAIPRGKVTKITKTNGKKFIVTYKVDRYDDYEKKVAYDMGVYKVTMKKSNNKNGFIITNVERTQTYDVIY